MIIAPISLGTSLGGLFVPFFLSLLCIKGIQYIDAVLYGMYYALLRKYGQLDEQGRLYITIKNTTVAKHLQTSASSVKRAKKCLQDARLIDVVRVGYGRTSRIYLYDYRDVIAANSPESPATSTAEEQYSVPFSGVPAISPVGAEMGPPEGSPVGRDNNICCSNNITIPSLSLPDNVNLSHEEYAHLGEIMGEHRDPYIRRYAKRKADKGYIFPCDYDALVSWWTQDREQWTAGKKRRKQQQSRPKIGDAGNSFDEDDFFEAALARSFGGALPPSSQN